MPLRARRLLWAVLFAAALAGSDESGMDPGVVNSTVTATTTAVVDAAGMMGVSTNGQGDLDAFLSSLGFNCAMIVACVAAFAALRSKFPLVYSSNALSGTTDLQLPDSLFGCVKSSLVMSTEERAKSAGLDSALLVEFCTLCMRILAMIALPMLVVLVPLHLFWGNGGDKVDRLSKIELGNVAEDHKWLYYVHAIVVWGVCLTTQRSVYKAQEQFMSWRFHWLKHLPFPRAATVLVEAIPPEYRSDSKLREFFSAVFVQDSIQETHMVKLTKELAALTSRQDSARQKHRTAELQLGKTGVRPTMRPSLLRGARVDSIDYYAKELHFLERHIKSERARVEQESGEVGGVNSNSGFVTFKTRRDAEMALNSRYSASRHEWRVSMPAEPSSVLWKDLKHTHHSAGLLRLGLGYACIAGLFVGFMPICLFVTNIAQAWHAGPAQPIWAAFAPTLGLMLFLSFLPSVLLLVFRKFFILKTDARAQHKLQIWYFWFQVLYVILVTAVGRSMFERAKDLYDCPSCVFQLLAESLPQASHFYMNYLVLQWFTHSMTILRHMNLLKFIFFNAIHPAEEAHNLAEPEDQDYFGLGSRSARFTINMLIGIIFSTISPLMAVLALVNFALCRVFYGYLVVFAETRKPDLGGVFWISQLRHVQIGVMIYCVLMIGMLTARAENMVPSLIAWPSLFYTVWSYLHFNSSFEWENLPLNEIVFDQCGKARDESGERYIQPELLEEAEVDGEQRVLFV